MAIVELVSLADVEAAAGRIAGQVRRTPLVEAEFARPGAPLFLKAESLQVGGSFKVRGATNAVSRLSPAHRARGVITHSSGNHAQALARAARAFGIECTVVMPHTTPEVKRRLTHAQGAVIELVDPAGRAAAVERIQGESGAQFVPPFDDPHIIAGQGTVGLEIVADLPAVQTVYVPVSGGGLLSGVAVAVRALAPSARIVAVEPELAGDFAEGWAKGERVSWDASLTGRTIADGLRVQGVGKLNWQHLRALVDDVVTVTEDQIVAALRQIVLEAKLVCEPSGAVAVAGYHADAGRQPGPAVAVVSGGNVDPSWLAAALTSAAVDAPTSK